jgi:hypothetical protein
MEVRAEMSICLSCNEVTVTTHAEHGLPVCQGCSPSFCTHCYAGARYSCAYFTSTVPESNWIAAENYMKANPDRTERVVRSGPIHQCYVVRIGMTLFRHVIRDGVVVNETPVDPIETCIHCGSYDRRYDHFTHIYDNGFVCTECANGILRK